MWLEWVTLLKIIMNVRKMFKKRKFQRYTRDTLIQYGMILLLFANHYGKWNDINRQ